MCATIFWMVGDNPQNDVGVFVLIVTVLLLLLLMLIPETKLKSLVKIGQTELIFGCFDHDLVNISI